MPDVLFRAFKRADADGKLPFISLLTSRVPAVRDSTRRSSGWLELGVGRALHSFYSSISLPRRGYGGSNRPAQNICIFLLLIDLTAQCASTVSAAGTLRYVEPGERQRKVKYILCRKRRARTHTHHVHTRTIMHARTLLYAQTIPDSRSYGATVVGEGTRTVDPSG